MRSLWSLLLILGMATAAEAQIAISVNDNKVVLANGAVQVVQNPAPTPMTVIDLKGAAPKVVAEIPVPASVVGPPLSVAITPDEGLALITSAMKVDPADKTKTINDNRMSVVDLSTNPPSVISTLETGRLAAPGSRSTGRAISPCGQSRRRHGVGLHHLRQDREPAGQDRGGADQRGPCHAASPGRQDGAGHP